MNIDNQSEYIISIHFPIKPHYAHLLSSPNTFLTLHRINSVIFLFLAFKYLNEISHINSADAAIKTRKGQSTTSKKYSQSAKAGLEFPMNKVAHFLKKINYADHVSAGAPVYLTAVLEYLAGEFLELAGNEAKNGFGNKKRINPRHLKLAVGGDDELKQLLHNVTIPNAGVMLEAHHGLLRKYWRTRELDNDSSIQN